MVQEKIFKSRYFCPILNIEIFHFATLLAKVAFLCSKMAFFKALCPRHTQGYAFMTYVPSIYDPLETKWH